MDTIKQRFEANGQGQVFKYWEELGEEAKASLLEQAEEIDLEELDHLVATLVKGDGSHGEMDFSALTPAPYEKLPADVSQDANWQEAKKVGEEALAAMGLAGALAAITAAVVGVVLNLSVWFALHVIFDSVTPEVWLALPGPDLGSFNALAAVFTLAAALLMLVAKRGFVTTMAVLAIAALGIAMVT